MAAPSKSLVLSSPTPVRNRWFAILVTVAIIAMVATATILVGAEEAAAAVGDPFDRTRPTAFISQQSTTRLYRAETTSSGNLVFTQEGTVLRNNHYNATRGHRRLHDE